MKGAALILAGLLAATAFALHRTAAKLAAVCDYVGARAERERIGAGLPEADREHLLRELAFFEQELERQTGQKHDLRRAKASAAAAICAGDAP